VVFEVRFHGRGGQGAVTAADLLALAAFRDGHRAQSFPSFGSERTGAPVVSFCRISSSQIRTREPVQAPDALIVQDATLLHQLDLFAGVHPDTLVLVNSPEGPDALVLPSDSDGASRARLRTVPASRLARAHTGRPVPNMALLGGFAAASGVVTIESVTRAIEQRFEGSTAAGNVAAALEAHDLVASQHEELADASAD
jgi:pyruvate ferredoxin oxidoreductase gamma subunit